MEQILPISELQHKAKRMLEMTRDTGEPIIVTQNGRPAGVLMGYENYEGWKQTLEEMHEADWKEKLSRAEDDVKHKRLTPLASFMKKGTTRGSTSHRRSKK